MTVAAFILETSGNFHSSSAYPRNSAAGIAASSNKALGTGATSLPRANGKNTAARIRATQADSFDTLGRLSDVHWPQYCAYRKETSRDAPGGTATDTFLIYPSEPKVIAKTIRSAVSLAQRNSSTKVMAWQDLGTSGQVIFCEVCKGITAANVIVANITTFNFNVMFELGFAIGKGKPVIPVRDASYTRDRELFEQIGVFDVIGYETFEGSEQLARILGGTSGARPIRLTPTEPSRREPTYIVRCPYNLDAGARVLAAIRKSSALIGVL